MAASGIKLHANPLGLPIGSQTYPHLACIQSGDLAGLVKHMKAIGIEAAVHCELKPSGIPRGRTLEKRTRTRSWCNRLHDHAAFRSARPKCHGTACVGSLREAPPTIDGGAA
jgi:hypothetical protein